MDFDKFLEHLSIAVNKFPLVVDDWGDIRTKDDFKIDEKSEHKLCPIQVVARHIAGKNSVMGIHDDIYSIGLDKKIAYDIINAADCGKPYDEEIRNKLEYYTMGSA